MKKSLAGLIALAAVAGSAHAQSNVTIFGIIDMAVSKANSGQSNLAYFSDWQIGKTGQWVMHSASSSRLGIRGTEDLGDGWKAGFLLDHRFQPDTGTVEPRDGVSFAGGSRSYNPGFWNAQAYVNLNSTSWGEVRLGRNATPTFNLGLATDPWALEYNVAGFAGFTRGGNFVGASKNAVTYLSPSLGGFAAQVLVGLAEGGTAATATAAPNGRNVGLGLRYNAGPLMAALAYNDSKRPDNILNRTTAFGLTYDFSAFKLFSNYALGKNSIASNETTRTWLLGAHVPVGTRGYVRTAVGGYDPAVGFNPNGIAPAATAADAPNPYAAYPVTLGQDTLKFGLGYVHLLSKRTSLSADVGTSKTETFTRSSGVQTAVKHMF